MIPKSGGNAQSVSIPAPVGGWNARDPLAEMPPTDAVTLDNWWPTSGDVRVREGCTAFATGLPGHVEALMPYSSTTTSKLFAVAGGGVYDVSAAGAVGAAATTFSNSRIRFENFTTAAGNFLYCCSGVDAPQHYNGTVWATPTITGVTSSTLAQPCAFKSRLFFAQTDSLSVWYLAVNSIAGAATELPLGGIFSDGGYIQALGTWTLDAGRGVDDHFVVVTNKGEVAIYSGSDPTSSSAWALVGVYRIGSPIGRNCMVKYGGDLLIICLDGVFPLSAALQSTRVDTSQAITDKIRPAISEATGNYGTIYGWQVLPYPDKNALILNVPVSGFVSHQYVMNAITGSWCRFTGWNAYSLALYSDNLYYGGNGTVYRAWTGRSDNGANIVADAKPAFYSFSAKGYKKHFQMVKPYFATDGTVSPSIRLNIDYSDEVPGSPSAIPTTESLWDTAVWDADIWGGALTPYKQWMKVNGVGYVATLRMKIATNTNEVRWYSTDFMVELGGIL